MTRRGGWGYGFLLVACVLVTAWLAAGLVEPGVLPVEVRERVCVRR